jgi:L-aspartate oxidase
LLESVVFAHRAVKALEQEWPENAPAVRWEKSGALVEVELQEPDHTASARVVDRVELQTLMWDNVGLARTGTELDNAMEQLHSWRPAALEHRLFPDWEDANLLVLARAVTEAAIAREESRGGHYRLDYPHTRPEMARPITLIRKAS